MFKQVYLYNKWKIFKIQYGCIHYSIFNGRVYRWTGHEGPEGSRVIVPHFH